MIRRPRVPSWPLAEFVIIIEIHRFLYPWWHLSPCKQPTGLSPVSCDFKLCCVYLIYLFQSFIDLLLSFYAVNPDDPTNGVIPGENEARQGLSHHSATLATPMKTVNSTTTRRLLARCLVENYSLWEHRPFIWRNDDVICFFLSLAIFSWCTLFKPIKMASKCLKLCSETTRLRLVIPLEYWHCDVIPMVYKSVDYGKLLSLC